MLFNATIATFEEYIHLSNIIIIKNGIARPINRKYASVNPNFELAFGQNTKITVSENKINIGTLPFSFKRFEEVTKTDNENIFFDVLGFITSVRPLYTTNTSVRREITIMNEEMDPLVLTLWGEHIEKEGQNIYSYFKAEISAIINPESPCYTACKSFQRKVFVEDSIANCNNCNTEDAEWKIK
ncbi:replication factor A protein 1-like [Asparagus officinalis]|uniref:replication factor A protein 1-like n=1 Tax=Asparagus officinalis TaxID=4686 RepID=UPI00098E54E7|nr:replication factor A protein 1-like [Asparagus officinalis]